MKKLKKVIAALDLNDIEKKAIEQKCSKLLENHLLDWILQQLSFEDQKMWATMLMDPRKEAFAQQFLAEHIENFQRRSKETLAAYEAELVEELKEVLRGFS